MTAAGNLTDESEVCALVTEPLRRYGLQFDNAADIEAINRWQSNSLTSADAAMLKSLRWYDYAPKPFADVDDMLSDRCPEDFAPPWLP